MGCDKWVCLGNAPNLEFSDMFPLLRRCDDSAGSRGFVEGIEDGRGFMEGRKTLSQEETPRRAQGRESESVSAAAASHTGTWREHTGYSKDACRHTRFSKSKPKDLATVCKAMAIAPRPIEHACRSDAHRGPEYSRIGITLIGKRLSSGTGIRTDLSADKEDHRGNTFL